MNPLYILQVLRMDIKQELMEYNIEYNVLQEEIVAANQHLEKLKAENLHNLCLNQQLQVTKDVINGT